jgi:hypothetical protein
VGLAWFAVACCSRKEAVHTAKTAAGSSSLHTLTVSLCSAKSDLRHIPAEKWQR